MFDNLTYTKSDIKFKDKQNIFGKKEEHLVNLKASTRILIKIKTRDEDVLTGILIDLLDSVLITNIYSSVISSDLEEHYKELMRDVCKECREKANVIVESLGSKITGVDKILYKSNGNLLNKEQKINNNYQPAFMGARSFENSVDTLDNCIEEACNKEGTFVNYNKVWAEGFVRTILEKYTELSDTVTVVFRIE